MEKLLKRPIKVDLVAEGRFEKFNLKENPFPSTPFVNQESADNRINGKIYEMEIRKKEYEQVEKYFFKVPQSDPNHLRMGYIIDTSYVGRGNGKSAFLVNLQQRVNNNFCLDISSEANKCFAIYLAPEPGGRTKTFANLVDILFEAIFNSGIIENCLAALRFEALLGLFPEFKPSDNFDNEDDLIRKLNSETWFKKNKIDFTKISHQLLQNEYLQKLPREFPLYQDTIYFLKPMVTQLDFKEYYHQLKKGKPRLEFIFSYLVDFFLATGFNGAYVFVDDFERIPDFQSARQKRDFALELRSCLFDGLYTNAKIGFYNFLLVLHAGVPRLIADAWNDSGMENRAPIFPKTLSNQIIPFEKLTRDHAKLLLKKYLAEYRISTQEVNELYPFSQEAVYKIAELSELNAAKILKMAYELLEKAITTEGQKVIDEDFIASLGDKNVFEDTPSKSIVITETTDLLEKATDQEQ